MTNTKKLIADKALRIKCGGVSSMTIWRWDNNPAMNFPPPIYINNRKYRDEEQVDAWLESRSKVAPNVDHLRKGAA